MRMTVEFEWTDAGSLLLNDQGRLSMPDVQPIPCVYRFVVSSELGEDTYIGETQNLRHRMLRNYASKHNGTTNTRIRNFLVQRLGEQCQVRLSIITSASVEIDGERSQLDFNRKSNRLVIENMALLQLARADQTALNLDN